MITADGYAKDPNIVPEGIVITWSKEMIEEGYGNLRRFIQHFKECMDNPDSWWLQKCKNKPKHDVLYVYIIYAGRVRYRVQFAGWERGNTEVYDGFGPKAVDWSRVIMTGPLVEAPIPIYQKGFQGFRYSTKLF